MGFVTRRRIGGAAFLVAAGWLGRETLAWLLGRLLNLITDGAGNVSLAAVPWQNSLALLLALFGGYLAFWPVRKVVGPTPQDRARTLANRATYIVRRIREFQHNPFLQRHNDPLEDIIRDGVSLMIDVGKEGYEIPNYDADSGEQFAAGLLLYFGAISPLWRDGHLDEAKSVSSRLAANAGKAAAETKPENFYDRY
jgi:hypothetical protein